MTSPLHFRYCPACGSPIRPIQTDSHCRAYCKTCDRIHYRNPTVGVAVIIMKDEKLLLVRRAGSYAGSWCIPCGHVEWDEDIRECAQREIKEETGLDVTIGDVFDAHSNFHDPEKQTVGIWFWGHVTGGALKPGSDADDARFFSLDQLPENMAFPTDIKICKRLKTYN